MGVSPRNSEPVAMNPQIEGVRKAAATLLGDQGIVKALKLARSELRRARRARSRKLFGFWTAVEAELEAARLDGGWKAMTLAGVVAGPPKRAAASFASADDARAKVVGQVWTSTARSS